MLSPTSQTHTVTCTTKLYVLLFMAKAWIVRIIFPAASFIQFQFLFQFSKCVL